MIDKYVLHERRKMVERLQVFCDHLEDANMTFKKCHPLPIETQNAWMATQLEYVIWVDEKRKWIEDFYVFKKSWLRYVLDRAIANISCMFYRGEGAK